MFPYALGKGQRISRQLNAVIGSHWSVPLVLLGQDVEGNFI
jgi:hypothetical protein